MLPDAFTPVGGGGPGGGDMSGIEDDGAADEDQLSTTPIQLLQAVELRIARLRENRRGSGDGGAQQEQLIGGPVTGGGDAGRVLKEIREDILTYWEGGRARH
jgi:hypothetical protein